MSLHPPHIAEREALDRDIRRSPFASDPLSVRIHAEVLCTLSERVYRADSLSGEFADIDRALRDEGSACPDADLRYEIVPQLAFGGASDLLRFPQKPNDGIGDLCDTVFETWRDRLLSGEGADVPGAVPDDADGRFLSRNKAITLVALMENLCRHPEYGVVLSLAGREALHFDMQRLALILANADAHTLPPAEEEVWQGAVRTALDRYVEGGILSGGVPDTLMPMTEAFLRALRGDSGRVSRTEPPTM
jgi:hypothetical protein